VSAADLAVVLGCVATFTALVGLLFAAQALTRTTRELQAVLVDLRTRAVPALDELAAVVAEAADEVQRVDRLIGTAEAIGDTVDGATRLTYQALSHPVITAVAVASGTGRAVRRLTGPREGRPA
jgi:hypothetical protein